MSQPIKLTLGFSPCPNDTLFSMRWSIKKIDTGGIDVEVCIS